jgi:outer membrane protein assembly factor BamB
VDGRVLLATTDALRSVAVEDGTDQWTTDGVSPRDVVVQGDTCYTRIRTRVTARSLDGRRRWAFDGTDAPGRGRFVAGPVATDDAVFAATGEHLFAVTTGGSPRWRVRVAERPRQLALTADLVVRTADRRLVGHWQRDQF